MHICRYLSGYFISKQKTTSWTSLNPALKIEVLLYADNCQDKTAAEMRKAVDMPEYRYRNVQIIERQGSGGKAGVLNDALEIAQGEYNKETPRCSLISELHLQG